MLSTCTQPDADTPPTVLSGPRLSIRIPPIDRSQCTLVVLCIRIGPSNGCLHNDAHLADGSLVHWCTRTRDLRTAADRDRKCRGRVVSRRTLSWLMQVAALVARASCSSCFVPVVRVRLWVPVQPTYLQRHRLLYGKHNYL
jgi:alpha-beta hydrolase superfamily lysophospholipase